jgi:hypothetical protein
MLDCLQGVSNRISTVQNSYSSPSCIDPPIQKIQWLIRFNGSIGIHLEMKIMDVNPTRCNRKYPSNVSGLESRGDDVDMLDSFFIDIRVKERQRTYTQLCHSYGDEYLLYSQDKVLNTSNCPLNTVYLNRSKNERCSFEKERPTTNRNKGIEITINEKCS